MLESRLQRGLTKHGCPLDGCADHDASLLRHQTVAPRRRPTTPRDLGEMRIRRRGLNHRAAVKDFAHNKTFLFGVGLTSGVREFQAVLPSKHLLLRKRTNPPRTVSTIESGRTDPHHGKLRIEFLLLDDGHSSRSTSGVDALLLY